MNLVPIIFRVTEVEKPGMLRRGDVTIESRGETGWACKVCSNCLRKDGKLEWEPSPSNRDECFIEATRFPTAEEAFQHFQTCYASGSIDRQLFWPEEEE